MKLIYASSAHPGLRKIITQREEKLYGDGNRRIGKKLYSELLIMQILGYNRFHAKTKVSMMYWRIFLMIFLLASSLFTEAVLAEMPKATDSSTFSCDLDGDGQAEYLKSAEIGEVGGETFSQIQIFKTDGTLLWAGPTETSLENPLVLYSGTGDRIVELFDDIDRDGRCELVISLPYTEIDLIFHHRFRWNGHGFDRLPDAVLRQQHAPDGGRFIWEANAPIDRMFTYWYVIGFQPVAKGKAIADLILVTDRTTYANRNGKALLRFTPDGADLIRWIDLPPPPEAAQAQVPSYTKTTAVTQLQPVVSTVRDARQTGYRARIGRQDHFNSRGRRLHDLRSVLRQDRYYFYRYGGDEEDTPDPYGFASKNGRGLFDRIRILPVNTSYSRLKNRILYGNPLLAIRIDGRNMFVEILDGH